MNIPNIAKTNGNINKNDLRARITEAFQNGEVVYEVYLGEQRITTCEEYRDAVYIARNLVDRLIKHGSH